LIRTTIALRLALVALGLALAACGGSSGAKTATGGTTGAANAGTTTAAIPTTPAATSSTAATPTPTGPALSRVALAARASAICSAATAAGRKLKAPANLTSSPRAAAAYFDQAMPSLDAETRAFQALNPAPAISAQWEAVLGPQVALDRIAEGLRQKAHAGQLVTLSDIKQLATVGQAIAGSAGRLGARCV
jgi:hypothetical protein